MSNKITKFFLVITFFLSIPIYANDTKHLDDTVAAGIIFKLGYLFGSEGTWDTMETANPKSFKNALTSITKDSIQFSDTERGKDLKKKAIDLITFLSDGVRLTVEPLDPANPNLEAVKFLKKAGLDPKTAGPAELAQMFTNRIATYAKLSKTPEWVYDSTKRENKSQ